ncbi:hypothetical protein AX14_002562, partial [Amanita brunnescens Koide BX004]
MHPSFPDRAILDPADKRHFLGRGDLAVASLKLYARRIFSDTSHWITAGHFLVDIFQGVTLNGSRDDFRRFVILVGTQLGFSNLALSMSESLDVNRKMADEYMRLRDVATTWKQKAKANSKDAKNGRKAQDELTKAQADISAILEERDIFIKQRRELMARDDQLTTELSQVHRDYGTAIDDNTKLAADIDALQKVASAAKKQLHGLKDQLSMAEHHRNKAEFNCEQAVFARDKALADLARDKAFYEARIVALSTVPIPTSQPDSETPVRPADAERAVLLTRIENLKKELSGRDAELAKLRSETSLSDDVNTLRTELAEAKAVSARLSGMYEQKSKDFRESELERLSLLGKQIIADGKVPKETPPARPRPASRRGRQRSRSTGRADPNAERTKQASDTERDNPSSATPHSSSQPFWQDEPLFTRHVAAVTTATMSALPHLPFEAAIANAFSTVRNVGPPPPLKLDKRLPGNRRLGAPSPPTPAPVAPQGNFTFADMVKAASAKADDAVSKKKPTWRAIETSKALVLRPSTKGTRVSELHLKIPKTAESADLFRLKGTALLERVAKLVNDHSEPAPHMALRENPLVLVKWSMKGNLVLKCSKPMDDLIKDGIKDALTYFFPSPSAEIMVLNKPPTTALKFLAVPRHNLDGSDTDEMDLLNDLTAHPAWSGVELWSNPKFINLRAGMAGATIVVSIVDDNSGSVGRRLMGTMVDFSGCIRPCKRWVELPSQPFCGQCQSWGHPGTRCPANVLICARCGGTHDYRQHDRYCDTCKKGPGHSCTPFCRNCRGNHMSTSKECPFYLGRTSKECHTELYAEIEAKFPKKTQKDTQAGPTRKTGSRKKVGFSNPDAEGFIQVGITPGIAHIDVIPPEPQPPASVKPLGGSIVGAIADEALRPELKGNDEARRLMQETLLDEAAFAAADAAAASSSPDPSGSPPLNLSVHELLENLQKDIDFLFIQENPISFVRNIPSSKSEIGEPLIGPVVHRQWQCIEKTALQPSSQVAIYVNNRFLDNFQIFPDFSPSLDPNLLVVTLKHNTIKSCSFNIVNVYNPPKTRNSAVRSLINTIPHLPNTMVIQGDFNLPSGIWDPSRNNSSPLSIDLFNHLSDEGFGLANDEGAPTWTNRRGNFSVLDLVFIHDSLVPLEPDVFVNMEGRGRSDHALLSLAFGTTEHWGRPYIPSGEEEEERFIQDLSDSICKNARMLNHFSAEEAVTRIGEDILNSWNRNSKTPRVGAGSTTWWTADCQRAKDEFLARRTRENQKIYDAATKKARQDFFGRKIDLMTANDSPWEGVRWTKPRPPPKYSTILRDGQPIDDVESLFNTMHSHFSTSPAAEHISWEAINNIPQLAVRSFPPVSQKEIWDALRPTTNSSAPGLDHVTWRHLKLALTLPETDISLMALYNKVCFTGSWPTHFKESTSVIIPKPNKPDYTIPKAYWPIALLNTLGKLLTKILANRLQHDAAEHGILHRDQFGGVQGHSTIDAGLVLTDFISEHRECGWHASACAIDVAQFFPSLSHEVMGQILKRLGFSPVIVTLIESYFQDRVTAYKWDNALSKKYDFSLGTPQGDCLSPILSALYISVAIRRVFPETMPPSTTRCLFYVDDGVIITASPSLQTNVAVLRIYLLLLQALSDIGLQVEASKTELIHFFAFELTAARRLAVSHQPRLDFTWRTVHYEILPSARWRYLG